MIIDFVTFTGIDDNTSIGKLEAFTLEHPNVEWGVLLAPKTNRPRFPTVQWIDDLASSDVGEKMSGHLCGEYAGLAAQGQWQQLSNIYPPWTFSHFQLNLWKHTEVFSEAVFLEGLSKSKFLNDTIILQVNGKHDYFADFDYTNSPFTIRLLYDKSGGQGVLTESYPVQHSKHFSAYAGGFGPANIVEELKKLANVVGDGHTAIDLETKLRNSDDAFDLEACRQVYEACRVYMVDN